MRNLPQPWENYKNMENCECRQPLIGQKIPDLELAALHENQEKKIKLAGYRGKWMIIFFYPADFTFVCPTELKQMAVLYPEFQKRNAEVFSVSTDTVYTHFAWHEQSPAIKEIKFPMLADPTGKLCRALNVYLENEGLALRGSFVVDPEGVIKAMEVHDNSIGRSAEELLRKLDAAIFVRENGGEVCPANWKPGSETLKPGLDLVGKI